MAPPTSAICKQCLVAGVPANNAPGIDNMKSARLFPEVTDENYSAGPASEPCVDRYGTPTTTPLKDISLSRRTAQR